MPKKKRGTLTRLIPHSVVTIDGHDVMVPNGPAENATANKLLASQMRHFLQEQIKKYMDSDVQASPKDLKDLAEAASNIAKFSALVYESLAQHEGGGRTAPGPQPAEKTDLDIDISGAVKPAEKDANDKA
jgi:hypothetical protein